MYIFHFRVVATSGIEERKNVGEIATQHRGDENRLGKWSNIKREYKLLSFMSYFVFNFL